jgi:sterol desaturase/sphingolipid hydroxylase (fatty acid hydroxylase superfamily)
MVITVVGAIVLIIAEKIWPYEPKQTFFREGLWGDFFWYTIVQSYVLGLVIFGFLRWVDSSTSFHRWQAIQSLPIWCQVVFFVVMHDMYIYWFHRLQHNNGMLWRTHEAHHSTQDVDWLSGSRSHSVEILINQTIEFAPIMLLASPEVAVIKGCIDALWGMYIHSNINVKSGWLQYILNGPEMHRWHHATDEEAHNKNFSTKLALWDWMFGTAYKPEDKKPRSYGLGEWFPKGYFSQHVYAFRKRTNQQ